MSKNSILNSVFSDIEKLGSAEEYKRIIKLVEKHINQFPEELSLVQSKLASLIHLNQIEDAYNFIQKNKSTSQLFMFEKAYCLYRLNRSEEALKMINEEPNLGPNFKELKAQILYKLERYNECLDMYRDIIKQSKDSFTNERETNLTAVISQVSKLGDNKYDIPTVKQDNTYEFMYNIACVLIERGDIEKAQDLLNQAAKLCRNTLEEEEVTEEEIQEELTAIKVQGAYCLQKLGREKEAQSEYTEVLKYKPKDIGSLAIASNNLVVLNREHNVFDSKKKLKSTLSDELTLKLNTWQLKTITLNHCRFALMTNQLDQCTKLCDNLEKSYPDLIEEIILLKAIMLWRQKKISEAIDMLKKFVYQQERSTAKLNCTLVAVKLLLMQNNTNEAIALLENLGELKYKLGITSTLVTLYLNIDNFKAASDLFNDTLSYYSQKEINNSKVTILLKQLAKLHLLEQNPKEAAKRLSRLLELNPANKKFLAQLIIAYTQFDPEKAQQYSKELPPLDLQDTDIDSLENTNWMMGSKLIKKSTLKPDTAGSKSIVEEKKRKKKRKIILPKNFNPDIPPNPERWLPRHERTGYRKKKDRRNKETGIGKGTQGASNTASEQFNIKNIAAQPKTQTTQLPSENAPRLQHRKGGQYKKKKKGK
ncbi:Tetratricopeptide repeat,Putative TPR-like repeat,Signal recognition particle, SRP72 [Cinara cedri]|uniref:Signal recognition particle subunit SRP72 n=1 Tax=Cinara cedri TaxID=506608 RepID=A0A5E4NJZ5_9HEMI|nr:Tetratricopeptide repeat,Putative TPR-like repeat,Signal recognition particle, SRP72 [Cinara cedri]